MARVKWESGRRQDEPLRGLREEVDRLFDRFFYGGSRPFSAGRPGPGWRDFLPAPDEFLPTVSVKETDEEYVVIAEVPGLAREDLDVGLTEDGVTLRGERKEKQEAREGSYHVRESSFGSFERVIPLPGRIVPEAGKAKLKDGVLTLTLPKAEDAKTREVKVKLE